MPHRTQYGSGAVDLAVGAAPGWVGLVRSAAAHIGAAATMSVTDIDDLRLAADESFATMLRGSAADEAVTVHLTWSPGSVSATFTREGDPSADVDEMSFLLLKSLVDDVTLDRAPHRTSLTWTYRAVPA